MRNTCNEGWDFLGLMIMFHNDISLNVCSTIFSYID